MKLDYLTTLRGVNFTIKTRDGNGLVVADLETIASISASNGDLRHTIPMGEFIITLDFNDLERTIQNKLRFSRFERCKAWLRKFLLMGV